VNGQPRVIVTVGTDHHPFDRLMRCIDDLVRSELVHPRDILVQSGSSAPPRYAPARSTLPRTELLQLMARAGVVIGHGGPGTVMDARSCGRRPIVVPRLAVYGEVVDDHQVAFGDFMAARGRCVSVRTRDHLIAELESWMCASQHPPLPPGALPSTTSSALATLSRSVVEAPPRRFSARRLLTVVRPARAADAAL